MKSLNKYVEDYLNLKNVALYYVLELTYYYKTCKNILVNFIVLDLYLFAQSLDQQVWYNNI